MLAPWEQEQMTPRQRKIFATCVANMEAETGKTLAEWVVIAQTCPETTVRERMAWLDRELGIRTMRAHVLMAAAFPDSAPSPDEMAAELWKDAGQRALADALVTAGQLSDDVIVAQRKGYTSLSRKVQFAAVRPVKGGVRIGLALPPETSARLAARARSEPLQDRLKSVVTVTDAAQVDAELRGLIRDAWAKG